MLEVLSLPVPVDLLRARRLEWIRALESGEFEQGMGALFKQHVTEQDEDGEPLAVDPDSAEFCCIGVARRVISPTWMTHMLVREADGSPDYERVRDYLHFDARLQAHLVAMNDGLGREVTYGAFEEKRTFRFIARFLRKVWGMSDV